MFVTGTRAGGLVFVPLPHDGILVSKTSIADVYWQSEGRTILIVHLLIISHVHLGIHSPMRWRTSPRLHALCQSAMSTSTPGADSADSDVVRCSIDYCPARSSHLS